MSNAQKTAGVLGGMGPEATVDFMAKVIVLTDADCDQDHVRMLIDHNPHVPNRQEAILRGGQDPAPVLADMAASLEAGGADFLVIPCNTAYVYKDAILAATHIPLISIIGVSIAAAKERAPDADRIGLLATDGCLQSGIYQAGLEETGLTAVVPTAEELSELMSLIKTIKGGRHTGDTARGMAKLAEALAARGAGVIIAGCTEIPLVLDEGAISVPLVSSTDALADITVKLAIGEIPLPDCL
jgi:aspartate racemase